jgi:hypothetical protein
MEREGVFLLEREFSYLRMPERESSTGVTRSDETAP